MAGPRLLRSLGIVALASALLAAATPTGAQVPETGVGPVDDTVDALPDVLPTRDPRPSPDTDVGADLPAAPLPGSGGGRASVPAPAPSSPAGNPWAGVAVGAGVLLVIGAAVAAPPLARRPHGTPARHAPHGLSPTQHFTRGLDMLERAEYADAVAHLRQGLRARPTDPAARYALGAALAQAGRVREALLQLDYAIRLNEDFLAVLVRDPDLRAFTDRPDVYRFVRRHAARYAERTQRGFA